MSEGFLPEPVRLNRSRTAATLLACLLAAVFALLALSTPADAAVNVQLRVEGLSGTLFSGKVATDARSVPGDTDSPACRADATPAVFSTPNAITAAADATAGAVTTSGTYYNWGTMLCSVSGERPADSNAGWLVRINQQDSTAPNGYVTATDPLSNNDSVLLYLSPMWGHYSSSLELRLPASAKPGEPVTGYVDSFDLATDAKSAGSAVTVSGGGASSTTAADGSFQITFATPGRHLITAEGGSGAIRGSQWVEVDEAAVPTPVPPLTQKQINKQRRIAARANCRATYPSKSGARYKSCIRTANRLGRTLTAKQRRIDARARCRVQHPVRGTTSRVRCVRAANRIGR